MSSYEIQKAAQALDSAKDDVKKYLKEHYPDETVATITFKYLEEIVTKIIKRQKVSVSWGSGASPCWHINIFRMLSSWIEAETNLSAAISEELK